MPVLVPASLRFTNLNVLYNMTFSLFRAIINQAGILPIYSFFLRFTCSSFLGNVITILTIP